MEPFVSCRCSSGEQRCQGVSLKTVGHLNSQYIMPAYPPSIHQATPLGSDLTHPQYNRDSDEEHRLWSQLYLSLNLNPVI